ncbi:MAG: hypothetical protein Q9188_004276 [Gyalolechia gomerana]
MPDDQGSNTPGKQQSTGYVPGDGLSTRYGNYFRLASGRMTEEAAQQWKLDRDERNQEADCARCPIIRFMRQNINKLGGDVHSENIRCRTFQWEGNLRHAACTEIRASTLSGECRWLREFWDRGQWKFTQQFQECIRRRAALSVAKRPECKDTVQAVKVVNEVWDSCFPDTRPFDEVYR